MIPSPEALRSLRENAETGKNSPETLAWLPALIDHTLLKPEATRAQLQALCAEAKKFHFGAVCVNPAYVKFCASELAGSAVKTVAVVGFPLGAGSTRAKAYEAREAIHHGAQEIDMVLAVGRLKDRDLRAVFLDVRKVVLACGAVPVKVILETSLLDHDEKIMAATIAKAAGAAFLKTSTGFSTGGATESDVALLRSIARDDMGVKASGGVKTLEDALRMVQAGADRLGTSSGVAIVSGRPSPGNQKGVY